MPRRSPSSVKRPKESNSRKATSRLTNDLHPVLRVSAVKNHVAVTDDNSTESASWFNAKLASLTNPEVPSYDFHSIVAYGSLAVTLPSRSRCSICNRSCALSGLAPPCFDSNSPGSRAPDMVHGLRPAAACASVARSSPPSFRC